MRKFLAVALVLPLALVSMARGEKAEKAEKAKMIAESDVVEVMLLRQKSVRDELKIDREESKKILEFTHKQHEAAEATSKLPKEQQKARWDSMGKENEEFLSKALKPEQRKRLEQIALQTASLLMVSRPEVARQLNITKEQEGQITKLQEDARKKFHELREAGNKAGLDEKLAELRNHNHEALAKLLTEDQKRKWKELVGAPFNGKLVFEEPEKGK
jgi:hypothetical protein